MESRQHAIKGPVSQDHIEEGVIRSGGEGIESRGRTPYLFLLGRKEGMGGWGFCSSRARNSSTHKTENSWEEG